MSLSRFLERTDYYNLRNSYIINALLLAGLLTGLGFAIYTLAKGREETADLPPCKECKYWGCFATRRVSWRLSLVGATIATLILLGILFFLGIYFNFFVSLFIFFTLFITFYGVNIFLASGEFGNICEAVS